MKVDKMSVSFDPALGDAIRAAATQNRQPLSTWLAEAAASKLRSEALTVYLDEWEATHGAFTAEELAAAARDLGLPPRSSAA